MPKSSGNSSNVTIYGVGSTVLATASFFEAGKSFISKIKADSSRQIEFDAINGHCPTLIPNPIHNTKPTTVNRYIPVEISLVLRDLIIFHAWGAKLAVETAAARTPRIVVNDIRLRLSSCRRLVGGAVDKTKEVLCVLPMLFTGDSVANIHLLREIAIAIVIALPITRCRIVLAPLSRVNRCDLPVGLRLLCMFDILLLSYSGCAHLWLVLALNRLLLMVLRATLSLQRSLSISI